MEEMYNKVSETFEVGDDDNDDAASDDDDDDDVKNHNHKIQ
jgi:hypothetical protein